MATDGKYRVQIAQHNAALPRLYKLLGLLDQGMTCNDIARLWQVSPQRIQQLRVKALALREKEGRP